MLLFQQDTILDLVVAHDCTHFLAKCCSEAITLQLYGDMQVREREGCLLVLLESPLVRDAYSWNVGPHVCATLFFFRSRAVHTCRPSIWELPGECARFCWASSLWVLLRPSFLRLWSDSEYHLDASSCKETETLRKTPMLGFRTHRA